MAFFSQIFEVSNYMIFVYIASHSSAVTYHDEYLYELSYGLGFIETCSLKKGINASAKSIDSGQPARTAQTDLSRYFLLLVELILLHVEGSLYVIIQSIFTQDVFGVFCVIVAPYER